MPLRRRLPAQVGTHQLQQGLAHQARLAGTGDPGHGDEAPQGELDIQCLQVVASDALQAQPALGLAYRTPRRRLFGEQVTASLRGLDGRKPRRWPAVQDLATTLAGGRADLHQPVGPAHDLQVMLHHEQ